MRVFKLFLITFLFALQWNVVSAQDGGFDRERYNSLRRGYEYSTEPEAPAEEEEDKPNRQEREPRENKEFTPFLPDWIAVTLAAGFVVVVIVLIYRNQTRTSSAKMEDLELATSVEQAEEDLLNVSLVQLKEEAQASNDLRMLVHLNFLELLQYLHKNEHIHWETYKTNGQYAVEISSPELRGKYMVAAAFFDRVWYGHKQINTTQFATWQQSVKVIMK